jgi:hypothetical protein
MNPNQCEIDSQPLSFVKQKLDPDKESVLPKPEFTHTGLPVEKMSFALPVEKRNTHHHAMVLYFTPAWVFCQRTMNPNQCEIDSQPLSFVKQKLDPDKESVLTYSYRLAC